MELTTKSQWFVNKDPRMTAFYLRWPRASLRRVANYGVTVILIVSILLYLTRQQFPPIVIAWIALFLGIVTLASLPIFNWNLFFSLRMIVLAIPGLAGGGLIAIGQKWIVCGHLVKYQTPEIATQMMLLTVMALCSTIYAWVVITKKVTFKQIWRPDGTYHVRIASYLLIAVISAILVGPSRGDLIFKAPYSSVAYSPPLGLNIFGILVVFSVITCVTYTLIYPSIRRYQIMIFIVAIILILYAFVLRGNRGELVSFLVAWFLLWHEIKHKKIEIWKLVLFTIALIFFSQVWAIYRATATTGMSLFGAAKEALLYLFSSAEMVGKGDVSPLGRITPVGMSTILFGTIGMADTGVFPRLYGISYLRYIPNTLPTFIYTSRPQGLAWIFVNYGETSGGGFLELAEAYLNFGMIGSIVIPGLISLFYFTVYRHALMRWSPQAFMWYGIAASMIIPTTLYGTFSLYKALVTWLIIEGVLAVIVAVGKRSRGNYRMTQSRPCVTPKAHSP